MLKNIIARLRNVYVLSVDSWILWALFMLVSLFDDSWKDVLYRSCWTFVLITIILLIVGRDTDEHPNWNKYVNPRDNEK